MASHISTNSLGPPFGQIAINGVVWNGGLLQVTENQPFSVQVTPVSTGQDLSGGPPLADLHLWIGGNQLGEGVIRPSNLGTIEWQYTPVSVAGLLPVLIVHDGNRVGFNVSVQPAKLKVEAYETLIQDLRRSAYGIAYRIHGPTHGGLEKYPPTADLVGRLLERFSRLEQQNIIAQVLHHIRLLTPHVVIKNDLNLVRPDRVRRMPQGELHRFIRQPDKRQALASQKRVSPDCYENRIIKLLLRSLIRLCQSLMHEAQMTLQAHTQGRCELSKHIQGRLQHIERTADNWARQLEQEVRSDPWPEVGSAAAVDRPSTILTLDPLYRSLFAAYRDLQATWESTVDSPLFTMPLHNLPDLYEMWCFTRFVETVQRGLRQAGRDHNLLRTREGSFEFRLQKGIESSVAFDVADNQKMVRVYYNKDYRSFTSATYTPDISLEVSGPAGAEGLAIFDAKYRQRDEQTGAVTYVQDDLDKMHTYRDAIRWEGRSVDAAHILYPGDHSVSWYQGAVGAISLLPADDESDACLGQTIGNYLSRHGIEWRYEP